MRKPKLRDWFFLLVPVVLLAGFAFWRQQNEKPQEPFRLVIKQIRREKLTPLDVYLGLDTKIAVLMGHKGVTPSWWGQAQKLGARPYYQLMDTPNLFQNKEWLATEQTATAHIQAISRSEPKYLEKEDAYLLYYTMRLRDARDTSAPIILKNNFEMWRFGSQNSNYKVVASVPMTYEIRRVNEKTVVSQASRYCPLKILSAKREKNPPVNVSAAYIDLEIEYDGEEPYSTSRILTQNTKLRDSQGRIFKCTQASSETTSSEYANGETEKGYEAELEFLYKGKPPKEPLTVETKISFNNCWPLDVKQTVGQ